MAHQLVIVAVCKNEAPFIKEWMEYHLILGVEHFYIYDATTDNTKEILEPYIAAGYVTYIKWTIYPAQCPAYNDFIFGRLGMDAQWAAFIDLDEYIIAEGDFKLLLQEYDRSDIAGLQIGWSLFGSNGHITRPEGLITENYIKCVDCTKFPERYTKGVVRPFRVIYLDDPHVFRPKSFCRMVREDYKEVNFGNHWHREGDFPVKRFRINHYVTKCYDDFQGKIARGGPDGGKRKQEEFEAFNSTANGVVDLRIQKYVPELRRRMYGKEGL